MDEGLIPDTTPVYWISNTPNYQLTFNQRVTYETSLMKWGVISSRYTSEGLSELILS